VENNMGRIQKVSDQHKMSIFDAMANNQQPLGEQSYDRTHSAQNAPHRRVPELKKSTPTSREIEKQELEAERYASWEENGRHPTLSHNTPDEIDLVRKGDSIRSARCAPDGITNEGGSGRGIGSSRNSIADDEYLDRMSEAQTNKEATVEERRAWEAVRAIKEAEYRDAHYPRLGENEAEYLARRGDGVTPNHTAYRSGKWVPYGQISMFDDQDFERIPERKMETREAKKDDSWQQVKRASTMQDSSGRYVDSLTPEREGSNYKNLHKDSVDRLFDSLVNNKNDE